MPFRDVLGHPTTLALLARAVGAGTLPPSLIFAGPEGVGKRMAALAMAQAINCTAPVVPAPPLAVDACGECPSCRRIARLSHPDVVVKEPGETGSIKIEAVRDILREVGYKPFEAKRRVVVFDVADALVVEAQNALLKTLEEPPPGSMLVLVTAQPGTLLPTVRSRCPVVRFGMMPGDVIAGWLMREEGLGEAQARAVAGVAQGSLGAARRIAAEASGAEGYRAAAQRVLEHLARPGDARQRLLATRDIAGKGGRGSAAGERDSLSQHLQAMAALIRDIGLLSTRADASAVVNRDLLPVLEALAPDYGVDRTLHAFEAVNHAIDALDRNASPKTVADWVVLQV
jgi:DNA polymerase-3 subunit delta'